MTEEDFKREDADLDREMERREALEREDIMALTVDSWRRAVRIAVAINEEAA